MSDVSDILGDGRLRKEILKCGEGDCPAAGADVSVHYIFRRGDDEQILDSSYDRKEPLSFTLGQNEVILAWEHGVPTMKPGERAVFRIHPDLAHGVAGCAGGAVPPAAEGGAESAAELKCEIELLRDAPGEGDDPREASGEELLQSALRAKERGNAKFKAGELKSAVDSYAEALRLVECETEEDLGADGGSRWVDSAQRDERKAVALACYLNLAQCEIRLGAFASAAKRATLALVVEPSSSKAKYRRGVAHLGNGDLEEARADLVEAARREPKNAEVRGKLEECRKAQQVSQQQARTAFGGMYNKKAGPADGDGTAQQDPAAVIWLHGLGDTGAGWSGNFGRVSDEVPGVRFFHPTAPQQMVTINPGQPTTSWFDLKTWPIGLAEPEGPAGMDETVKMLHAKVDELERDGVPAHRIVLGGFSQGGTAALLAGLSCSKRLAGIVSISGWATYREGLAKKVNAANAGVPCFFCCGTGDPVVDFALTKRSGELLESILGDNVSVMHVNRGMHQAHASEMKAAMDFMIQALSP